MQNFEAGNSDIGFEESWHQSLKDFLNSTFWSWPNFVPFHLVHEQIFGSA
jgi:hypothetical protein